MTAGSGPAAGTARALSTTTVLVPVSRAGAGKGVDHAATTYAGTTASSVNLRIAWSPAVRSVSPARMIGTPFAGPRQPRQQRPALVERARPAPVGHVGERRAVDRQHRDLPEHRRQRDRGSTPRCCRPPVGRRPGRCLPVGAPAAGPRPPDRHWGHRSGGLVGHALVDAAPHGQGVGEQAQATARPPPGRRPRARPVRSAERRASGASRVGAGARARPHVRDAADHEHRDGRGDQERERRRQRRAAPVADVDGEHRDRDHGGRREQGAPHGSAPRPPTSRETRSSRSVASAARPVVTARSTRATPAVVPRGPPPRR